MGENISKYLLSQFYGLNEENFVSLPSLSSSMGTGNFESTISDGHHSKKQLIQSLKKAVYNQQLTKNENKFHNQLSSNMGRKSPHILTIDDIVNENEIDEVSQDFSSDGNVIVDLINNKITSTKNFPKPEDTKAAPSKTSEANNTLIINNSIPKLPSASVKMVKKLWRQKTMLLKENFNYLSKMNGNHLDLNSAGINHFPQEILQLTNLQMLYLDFNNLTILPDEIFTTLKYLKWLDLRNNQLISIPASIKGHESLETLLLQRNNIEKLPLELGLVPNLKNLQTARNPLIYPSQDILDLDCSEIIHFLRNEWKKAQPDESLIKLNTLNQNKIEQKPSTIICYQMNSKKVLNNTKHQNTRLLKPSVRSKSWNYKPSSRCQIVKDNTAIYQKRLWMDTVKKLLYTQTLKIQKSVNKSVLNEWRYNYVNTCDLYKHSRYKLDTPFALHNQVTQVNVSDNQIKIFKFESDDVNYFNKQFREFTQSLKKLDDSKGNLSHQNKKEKLETDIRKIAELQKKIQKLKFYNNPVIAS